MTLPAVRSRLSVSVPAATATLVVALLAAESPRAQTGGAPGHHVRATLVAEKDAVVPGRPLAAGIRLQMEAGWHTYWRNPGDSGLPTRVRWTLPEGFAAGELQWPAPDRFPTGPIVSYGYSSEVLLPVEIRPATTIAAAEARLAARVDWLECQEACLPGRAELTLTLPVRATTRPAAAAPLFAEARRRLPTPAAGWRITASAEPKALLLVLRPPVDEDLKDAYLYPLSARVLDHAEPQTLEREAARRYLLRLSRDPNGVPVERLAGVLVVETVKGRRALTVDAPVAAPPPARTSRN